MSTYLFTKVEGETAEETRKRWISYENERHAKVIEQGCSVCGEKNLDEYACFNCKATGECINCCGCEEE